MIIMTDMTLVLCVHISLYCREETIPSAQGVGALQTTTFHGEKLHNYDCAISHGSMSGSL